MKNIENILIAILVSVAIIVSIGVYNEVKKPVSKDTLIEIINMDMQSECYGDHASHCIEWYQEKINRVNKA